MGNLKRGAGLTLVVASTAWSSFAGITGTPTSSFMDMPGGVYLELSDTTASAPVGPFIFTDFDEEITVTTMYADGDPGPYLCGSYTFASFMSFFLPRDPDVDPGNWHGRFESHSVFDHGGTEIVFNFSSPLDAFGVTVMQFDIGFGTPTEADTLRVYSEPNGQGMLLGSVSSAGRPPAPGILLDFFGFTFPTNIVQSAVLSSGSPNVARSLYLDGISVRRASGKPACPADLTGDGELNFFDVSAFLSAFASSDPIADFTNDGVYNFFDVSAFLSAFSAGCP